MKILKNHFFNLCLNRLRTINFLLAALLLFNLNAAHSQNIDFANFTYSLPDCQEYQVPAQVTVRDGEYIDSQQQALVSVDLNHIIQADLTGDGSNESIVTVHCGWYGANYTSPQILIFSTRTGQAVPIAQLADYLFAEEYRRYYQNSDLWPELSVSASGNTLLINKGADGAHCCPEYQVVFSYVWNGQQMVSAGQPHRQKADGTTANTSSPLPPPQSAPPTLPPPPVPSETQSAVHYYYEVMETSNIREQPNTSAAILGTLNPGFRVIAEDSENPDWYRIYLDNYTVAYIYKPLLRRIDEIGAIPIGALSESLPLQGSFWLMGDGHDSVGDSHFAMELTGDAARVLYHSMKVTAKYDECSGVAKMKTIGALSCSTDDDVTFRCDFSIDIARQQINYGSVC